jgi:hypothetical protein
VCRHPRRKAIDRALKLGMPAGRVASRFGISGSILSKHRKHVGAPQLEHGWTAKHRGRRLGLFGGSSAEQKAALTSGREVVAVTISTAANVRERARQLAGNGHGQRADDVLAFALLSGIAHLEREAHPFEADREDEEGTRPVGRSDRPTVRRDGLEVAAV